jgi:excinuclease UvrABC helicase subunit UvrB
MIVKTFLLLPQGGSGKVVTQSYIAVKQAYINHEIAQKTERVGNYGILFTTDKNIEEVTKLLKMKKDESYLLIELTKGITSESISGFMPHTDIDELRALNLENLKDNAKWLELELNKAVDNEDFERAAEIRDKIKNEKK